MNVYTNCSETWLSQLTRSSFSAYTITCKSVYVISLVVRNLWTPYLPWTAIRETFLRVVVTKYQVLAPLSSVTWLSELGEEFLPSFPTPFTIPSFSLASSGEWMSIGSWLAPANSGVEPSADFAESSVGKYFAHQRFLPSITSSPQQPQPQPQHRHHDNNNTSHHSSHIIHNTFGHLGTTRLLIVLGVSGTCWHFQQDLPSLADPHLPHPSPHLPVIPLSRSFSFSP